MQIIGLSVTPLKPVLCLLTRLTPLSCDYFKRIVLALLKTEVKDYLVLPGALGVIAFISTFFPHRTKTTAAFLVNRLMFANIIDKEMAIRACIS